MLPTEALQRLLQSFNVKQALTTRNLGMRICIKPAVIDQLVELRTTWIQEAFAAALTIMSCIDLSTYVSKCPMF